MNVLDMKVGWHIGWMNFPGLNMLLDEPPTESETWRMFPTEKGNYLLSYRKPVVRFFFESDHGGGALGREVKLEDGSTRRTNGGWSSNAAQINRLRALDPRFAEYLPHDAVEITYYGEYARPGTYNDGWGLGMAGVAFDLPWVQEQIATHLKGVELLDLTDRSESGRDEHQASAEQSLIIGGASGYGYIPVPIERDRTTREGLKPPLDSELFMRTAMAYDRERARTQLTIEEKQ